MSQVIIRRKAGQAIPEAYFQLAKDKCPKVWGFSVTADNKLETMTGTDLSLEQVRDTEKDFNDVPFTLYMSSADKATNLKDVSPYDLIGDDDDNVLLCVHIAGEFPGYVKEKSSMSSNYHLGVEIAKHAEIVYDAVDKDLGKLMNKLGDEKFRDKIKMNAVSLGYIHFVAQNGAEITIAQGDTAKEFPWGWVSDTFGYTEGVKEEPKPEKKKGGLLSRSTVREKVNHQPSNNVVAAGVDKPKKTETAVEAPPPKEHKPKAVPLSLQNITVKSFAIPGHLPRKLAKRHIKERIGHVPPNYQEQGAKFQMYVGPDGKQLTLSEVKNALGLSASQLVKLDNPKAQNQKDVEPKHIDSSKIVSNPRPVLSPSSRERFQRYFSDERVRKIIGENAGLVTDPDNVQGYEGKVAAIYQQLGMKDMEDFDHLPFPEFEAIGRTSIHDLACVLWHYKTEFLKMRKQMEKLKPKVVQETVKEPEVQEAPPKRRGLLARTG